MNGKKLLLRVDGDPVNHAFSNRHTVKFDVAVHSMPSYSTFSVTIALWLPKIKHSQIKHLIFTTVIA